MGPDQIQALGGLRDEHQVPTRGPALQELPGSYRSPGRSPDCSLGGCATSEEDSLAAPVSP